MTTSLATSLVLAAGALAQPVQSPFPSRDEAPAIAPTNRGDTSGPATSIKLASTALPADFELPRTTTLPEGTSVARVAGTLVRAKDEYFFVPDADARIEPRPDATLAPAMILLRNQRLEQVAAGLISRGDRATGTLWAQVFAYRGRAYALMTQYTFAVDETPLIDTSDATQDPKPSTIPTATPATDDVSRIVRDLQQASEKPRALARPDSQLIDDRPRRGDDDASVDQSAALLTERTLMVKRRGRLVRLASADGRFAFSIDNDNDSPAPKPLLLQPCASLEAIEALAGEHGEDLAFEVSGRVATFGGRNYLLPEFFQVVRSPTLRSRQ